METLKDDEKETDLLGKRTMHCLDAAAADGHGEGRGRRSDGVQRGEGSEERRTWLERSRCLHYRLLRRALLGMDRQIWLRRRRRRNGGGALLDQYSGVLSMTLGLITIDHYK